MVYGQVTGKHMWASQSEHVGFDFPLLQKKRVGAAQKVLHGNYRAHESVT